MRKKFSANWSEKTFKMSKGNTIKVFHANGKKFFSVSDVSSLRMAIRYGLPEAMANKSPFWDLYNLEINRPISELDGRKIVAWVNDLPKINKDGRLYGI